MTSHVAVEERTGGRVARFAAARLADWLGTPERRRLLLLLAATLVVFVGLAPLLHYGEDLGIYGTWGVWTREHFFNVYSYGAAAAPDVWSRPEYPPGVMYLFALWETLYFGVAHLVGAHPSACTCSPIYRTYLKLPAILAHVATVAIVYHVARGRHATPRAALLISATYAFTVAAFADVLMWGQTDSLATLAVIAGLLLAIRRAGVWSGVVLGLAVMLKPQPAIFVPLALVYLLRVGGWREAARAAGGLAGVVVGLWLPYLLPFGRGGPEILVWKQQATLVLTYTNMFASRTAYNVWWLLGVPHQNVGAPLVGPLTPLVLGTGAFCALVLAVLVGLWRDPTPARLWAGSALVGFGFFSIYVLEFERYAYPAIALFLLAGLYDRRYWLCYVVVTITAPLNMLAVVESGSAPLSVIYGVSSGAHNALFTRLVMVLTANPTTWLIALANSAALVLALVWYFGHRWWGMGRGERRSTRGAATEGATVAGA